LLGQEKNLSKGGKPASSSEWVLRLAISFYQRVSLAIAYTDMQAYKKTQTQNEAATEFGRGQKLPNV
jgi:hypothetical protein